MRRQLAVLCRIASRTPQQTREQKTPLACDSKRERPQSVSRRPQSSILKRLSTTPRSTARLSSSRRPFAACVLSHALESSVDPQAQVAQVAIATEAHQPPRRVLEKTQRVLRSNSQQHVVLACFSVPSFLSTSLDTMLPTTKRCLINLNLDGISFWRYLCTRLSLQRSQRSLSGGKRLRRPFCPRTRATHEFALYYRVRRRHAHPSTRRQPRAPFHRAIHSIHKVQELVPSPRATCRKIPATLADFRN